MKNSSRKKTFQSGFSFEKSEGFENENDDNLFFPKAVNPRMTNQLTIPPARIWDNIEQILDEQDNRRKSANKMIASSFRSKEKQNQAYLFALGGLSLLAGFFWFIK